MSASASASTATAAAQPTTKKKPVACFLYEEQIKSIVAALEGEWGLKTKFGQIPFVLQVPSHDRLRVTRLSVLAHLNTLAAVDRPLLCEVTTAEDGPMARVLLFREQLITVLDSQNLNEYDSATQYLKRHTVSDVNIFSTDVVVRLPKHAITARRTKCWNGTHPDATVHLFAPNGPTFSVPFDRSAETFKDAAIVHGKYFHETQFCKTFVIRELMHKLGLATADATVAHCISVLKGAWDQDEKAAINAVDTASLNPQVAELFKQFISSRSDIRSAIEKASAAAAAESVTETTAVVVAEEVPKAATTITGHKRKDHPTAVPKCASSRSSSSSSSSNN